MMWIQRNRCLNFGVCVCFGCAFLRPGSGLGGPPEHSAAGWSVTDCCTAVLSTGSSLSRAVYALYSTIFINYMWVAEAWKDFLSGEKVCTGEWLGVLVDWSSLFLDLDLDFVNLNGELNELDYCTLWLSLSLSATTTRIRLRGLVVVHENPRLYA